MRAFFFIFSPCGHGCFKLWKYRTVTDSSCPYATDATAVLRHYRNSHVGTTRGIMSCRARLGTMAWDRESRGCFTLLSWLHRNVRAFTNICCSWKGLRNIFHLSLSFPSRELPSSLFFMNDTEKRSSWYLFHKMLKVIKILSWNGMLCMCQNLWQEVKVNSW